ncbi:MAG: hypothetical protein M3Z57_04805 [Candidatus Dormibacteraeota bacterium]|nr:hypothetical protein [Candidatus Dormibacteraeota bacterium]
MSARNRAARRESVQLTSAGQTVVSFVLRPVDDGGPWPLTRVLTALGAFDVERIGVARALGDRRGVPLVHSQELRWREQSLFLEARHGRDGADELSLELPPWEELVDTVDDDVWLLIDAVATASDAQFGSIGDGEPPETALPDDPPSLRAQLRRHLALLLPEWSGDDVTAAQARCPRVLGGSGLLVVMP